MGAEALMNVGYLCLMISIWGSIQLFIMGIFYKMEAVTLYEDCEPHDPYDTYEGFIDAIQKNYAAVSLECFYAAAIYLVLIFVSIICIRVATQKMQQEAIKLTDDESFCTTTKID